MISGIRSTPPWLVGCLLVAAGLRFFRLGHQPLWIDELISLELATYAQGAEFWRGLLTDIHGPFNSAILHGWVAAGGMGETWLRTLYVLPSLATIPVVYLLARDLFDTRAGKVAAWVAALSPFHVWYAQEVRSYSWTLLWAALALWLYLRLWDDRARRGHWIALSLVLALAVLTNFSVAFLLLALSAATLLRRPFSSRFVLGWVGVLAFVGVVFLPWFLDWYGRIGGERLFTNAPPPMSVPLREAGGFSLLEVPYTAWSFAFGYSLGPSLRALHLDRSVAALMPYLPVLTAGALAVAGGLLAALPKLREHRRTMLLVVLVAVPLLLAVFLAARGIKTFHPRYLVVTFPLFLAWLGAGWSRPGLWVRSSGVVAAGLALFALGQHYYDDTYAKEDCRSAARLVREHEAPGDSVVVIYAFRPFRHYFEQGAGGAAELHHVHKRFLRTDDEMRAHVADVSEGATRVWLVLTRWWDVGPEDRIRRIFEESLSEEERWEFPGVKVTLYEGRPA